MDNKLLFKILKNTSSSKYPQLSIPVGNPIKAIIRPISINMLNSGSKDVYILTAWRNKYVNSFLTEFTATEQRTLNWLVDVVEKKDNKILFMVDTIDREIFAYIGIDFINWETGYAEVDSVVRGNNKIPGLMTDVVHTLLMWAKYQLGLKEFGVRVRSDNSALVFYKKAGFVEYKRIPLKKKNNPVGTISWVENTSLSLKNEELLELVYMRFKKII